MTDYKKVAQLIKDGGYATSLTYVDKLCSIIEKWNLTQYDVKETAAEPEKWYRVRKSWTDAKSQKGAYKVLANAKKCADANPGYKKLLVRSGGADSPREIVLRQRGDGKWFLWDQFLLAGIRVPKSEDPWA